MIEAEMEEPDGISLKLLIEEILEAAQTQLITEESLSTEVVSRLQMEEILEGPVLTEGGKVVLEPNNNNRVVVENIRITNGPEADEEMPVNLAEKPDEEISVDLAQPNEEIQINLDEEVTQAQSGELNDDNKVVPAETTEEININLAEPISESPVIPAEAKVEEIPLLSVLTNDNLTILEQINSTCVHSTDQQSQQICETLELDEGRKEVNTEVISEAIASNIVVESVSSTEEVPTVKCDLAEICATAEVTESTGVVDTLLSANLPSALIEEAKDLNKSLYDNVESEVIEDTNSPSLPGSVPIADVFEDEIKLRSASSTANSQPNTSTPKKSPNYPVALADPLRHDRSLKETPLERQPLTHADLMNRIEAIPMIDDEIEEFEQYKVARIPTDTQSGTNGLVPLKSNKNANGTGAKGRFRKLCCF